MSITYVGGKTASTVGITTSWTVSLTDLTGGTASQPSAGDLVLIGFFVGTTGGSAYDEQMVTAGYTRHQNIFESESTFNANLAVYYKFMTGTPDTSVDFPETGTTARAGAATIQVFSGVHADVFDVTTTTASGDNYGRPDPPAITPTTPGTVIAVIGGASAETTVFTNGQLSNFLTTSENDTYPALIGAGTYTWTSGSFNPSEFGGGGTSGLSAWIGATMALKTAGYEFTKSETTTLTDYNDFYIGDFFNVSETITTVESVEALDGITFTTDDVINLEETLVKISLRWKALLKNASSWTNLNK